MSGPGRRGSERILRAVLSMIGPPGTSSVVFGADDEGTGLLERLTGASGGGGAPGEEDRGGSGEAETDRVPVWLRDLRRGLEGPAAEPDGSSPTESGTRVPGADVYARRWAARRRDLEMEAVSVAAGAVLFGAAVFGALTSLDAGGVIPLASGIAGTAAWAFSFGSDVARELLKGETGPPG